MKRGEVWWVKFNTPSIGSEFREDLLPRLAQKLSGVSF